jgi:hypothetical protein
LLLAPAAVLALSVAGQVPVGAHPAATATGHLPDASAQALMDSMNGSGVTGSVRVTVEGTQLRVQASLEGLVPGQPHAMHIHGALDGSANECPPPSADVNGDGVVDTPEGIPFYGGIQASLTTEGDTSPASALAVARFSTADDGTIAYDRTFEVSAEVAAKIQGLHVVVHGVDLNGSGVYDGDAKSPLDDTLPLEATAPAACGELAPTNADAVAYSGDIEALNGSGVTGRTTVVRHGNELNVSVALSGLSADLPHAMHIHGELDGSADTCPPPSADANHDGVITTAEGIPFYGSIQASLTTEGDTSPASALAVDRFDSAAGGTVTYNRTFTVAGTLADALEDMHIVVHGIDMDGSGAYDGVPSTLDPSVPQEATLPVGCAELAPAPDDALWLVGADGGIFALGSATFGGSLGANPPGSPAVDVAVTPTGRGYWFASADGDVHAFGDAADLGGAGAGDLGGDVVGIARTATGGGYWLVTGIGEVLAFGDAATMGDASALPLNSPIVDLAPTPTGDGYWLVAADGGVFAYGDAGFFGSAANLPLNQPVIGMTSSIDGQGYMLFAADGGVFAYGDVRFRGSTGGIRVDTPVVDVTATPSGEGYWVATSEGMVYAFGDAAPVANLSGMQLNAPIAGAAS